MTLVTNTAEGGTVGVTVSTGNSGGASGTAFSAVNKSATATQTYDNTQAMHGTKSIHCVCPGNTFARVTLSGASSTSYAARMYIRFNALPGAGAEPLLAIGPGGIGCYLETTNKLGIHSNTGALLNAFATTLSVGVWYRLEVEMTAGTTTTNGYIAGRYFLGDATTPADTAYSSSTKNTGTVAVASADFGVTSPNIGAAFDLWMDDLAISDGAVTPIGPAAVPSTAASGTAELTFAASAAAAAVLFAGWGIPL
jgi:hypothetical protein